ncbi:eukaryotic translation initiation factor 2 subunit 1 [Anaeramoeba flamelloides]|uniref:Eukaryotic translation initiation factor 2 subunit 1 n=1 Tax=Anaeramoeba flamelloides TaxID=1746091 RepID=A0ABQ8YS44_9EUKA|nr:eukaryotic translation initiation factor 2 subunit 1 [Anaeramoeba flamelloides]
MSNNEENKNTKKTQKKKFEKCRFYENIYPQVGDLVVAIVTKITDMGVYASLIEYNNIEGMIVFSELTTRSMRSINKVAKIGRQEICVVLRVDQQKGYIDLSRKRANNEEEIKKCEKKFKKSKEVHSIIRHLSDSTGCSSIELYESFCWPLYSDYGHAYDAFSLAYSKPAILNAYEFPENVKEELLLTIRTRMTPHPVKIRADVQLTCFTYNGIGAIRESLMAGEELGDEIHPIEVTLVAPPHYIITTTTLDKRGGIKLLKQACLSIKKKIEEKQGNFELKKAPRVVSAKDDRDLVKLMKDLELNNQDVDDDEIEPDEY